MPRWLGRALACTVVAGAGVIGGRPAVSAATSTQFQLSPNTKYLATDPNNHFWISGRITPHIVAVPRGRSCALSVSGPGCRTPRGSPTSRRAPFPA